MYYIEPWWFGTKIRMWSKNIAILVLTFMYICMILLHTTTKPVIVIIPLYFVCGCIGQRYAIFTQTLMCKHCAVCVTFTCIKSVVCERTAYSVCVKKVRFCFYTMLFIACKWLHAIHARIYVHLHGSPTFCCFIFGLWQLSTNPPSEFFLPHH